MFKAFGVSNRYLLQILGLNNLPIVELLNCYGLCIPSHPVQKQAYPPFQEPRPHVCEARPHVCEARPHVREARPHEPEPRPHL